ncbi:MAG TPA: hypothetical protein VFL14_04835 [Xanthomonadales bacterium]|nr:hypothetical protein [Xanthomonadales bacterium]
MRMHRLAAAFALAALSTAVVAQDALAVRFDSGTISGLGARNIGSATMSGRIAAVAGRNVDGKSLLYVGAASGGVWKSTDGGTTFKPVFDKQPVQSIGAVAIDPANPQVVWVGTGESWTRNSVSIGNGIYKSTDGGDTWTNMGLPDSERISRIVVDPKDTNTVYACVPGRLWSDSTARGLYVTRDGGRTWTQALKGPNASTGCADVSMDPTDAGHLFVSLWDFRRKGWTFRSGGDGPEAVSGSGLFESRDGGRTFASLEPGKDNGLPAKPWGRIGVTIAPSDPKRVYAVIEGVRSALFRSDDGGRTWTEGDRSQSMVWRPFYFSRLIVDPKNPDKIFKPNLPLIVSLDGGKSFSGTGGGAHGDWHDMWIDPDNTNHVVGGDDGGLWLSYDGGNRWWKGDNLPISQFYHVSVDDKDPYQVYGGLQDNGSWAGDSAYPGGITNARWENLYFGDGFWVFPSATNENVVYAESQGGFLGRIDRKTHLTRFIQPTAGFKEKLRYNWNTPIELSPNEKGTIYIGAQFLFRSRDEGQNWERISPDLTTNDPLKQKQEESGGITVDNSAAEMHTTIYSISESPKDGGTIWVGTDDGNVQLTRDGGKSWTNVVGNIKGLPKNSWVSTIEASRHDAATAYATFDRHTFGDFDPYVYRTRDFGKSWQKIAGREQGLRGYAHVVKEDSVDRDLLFVGTEFGLWISTDGGARWAEFKGGNFPSVAVRDIAVQSRDGDLVLGTHGRGIWVIDDISPLRSIDDAMLEKEAAFVSSRPVQQRIAGFGGTVEGDARFVGENPSNSAVITYYQRTRHLFGDLRIEVLDASGKVIETLPASKRRGLNRITWSMREKPPVVPPAAALANFGTIGPRVLPGAYKVRMTKNKQVYEMPLEVGLDRRTGFTAADRKAQYDAAMRVHGMFGEMSGLMARINAVREQANAIAAQAPEGDPLRKQVGAFAEKVDAVRKEIVATKEGGAITGEERLREKLDNVYGAIVFYEGAPGAYQLATVDALEKEMDGVSADFDALVANDLPKLNAALKAKGVPEIRVPPAQPVAESNVSSADINAAFAAWRGASFDLDRGTDIRERD